MLAVVIRSAAKKAFSLPQLAELVGAEIHDDTVRAAFVKKIAAADRFAPTDDPSRSLPPRDSPTQSVSLPTRFDPNTLARAEAALAKYIGAVAKVVVKRAAAKARDESELYLLLADQIEDRDERKAFVRKAISVSGRN